MKKYIVITFIIFSFAAQAQVVSDLKLYSRCFAHLVGEKAEGALYEQVKNKTKTGEAACLELMSYAELSEGGLLKHSAGEQHELGKKILQNMQKVHLSWYVEKNFGYWGADIFDHNDYAAFSTIALFMPNQQAKSIVTSNENYSPVRTPLGGDDYWKAIRTANPIKDTNIKFKSAGVEWDPDFAHSGELQGFRSDRVNSIPFPFSNKNNDFEPVLELHKNIGSGMIGNTSYIMSNTEGYKETDGGVQMFRRWSQRVVRHLLCQELPVITSAQAQAYVDPLSSVPFKSNSSCMSCHATMDSLAGTIRHVSTFNIGKIDGNYGLDVKAYHSNTIAESEEPLLSEDANFHRRPRRGRFVYYDIMGKFYDVPLESLQEFGEFVSGNRTDGKDFLDFYACQVNRYLSYFTGIQAEMRYSSLNNLNSTEKKHRDFVIQLAQELKVHQSLSKTITDIIKSPYYRDRFYRSE